MAQNETQDASPWLDLDRPTPMQFVLIMFAALCVGALFGLLFS
jgi:hypothetical protein